MGGEVGDVKERGKGSIKNQHNDDDDILKTLNLLLFIYIQIYTLTR